MWAQLAGTAIASERVVYFPGAQTALYAVCQCLLDAGDEVIVPEPTYVTYEAVLGSTGARIVNVPLLPERRFHLEPDDVERAVTSRTRAVLLTSPHNPTGAVMTPAEITAVGRDLPPARPVARVRRGVRGSDVRRRARESALAVGHRRPRRLGLEPLQVALDDRLARRLGDRAGRARGAPDLPHDVHALRRARGSCRTRRCTPSPLRSTRSPICASCTAAARPR